MDTFQNESRDPGRRQYPQFPIPSVHALVVEAGKVLLIQRKNQPNQGLWAVPAGAVELGESVHDAARRELLEESGIEGEVLRVLDVVDLIYPDSDGRTRYHYVGIYLLMRRVGGNLHAGSDAFNVRWVGPDEMDGLDMPGQARDLIRRIVRALEQEEGCPPRN